MRQLMVKALEESKKNGITIRQSKASSSPKMQAINLLVVDYLFHEDYLYTVSVFASEVSTFHHPPSNFILLYKYGVKSSLVVVDCKV